LKRRALSKRADHLREIEDKIERPSEK